MKNTLFTLLITLLAYTSQAQTTIVGTLKHGVSKESIPFANIYIELNTSIGTVSNTNGGFTIKIPTEYNDKTIVFSSIGFKKKVLQISELLKRTDPVIYLIPETTELDDIVVLSKYPNPKKILRKAINRISRNYINKPYQEDFFYRQINYRDSTVSRVVEASLILSDKGYTKDLSKLKLSISELRKTRDLGFQDFTATLFGNLTNPMGNPHFALNFDYVREANTKIQGLSFRNNLLQIDSTFSVFKDFKISLENAINFDGDLIYVLLLSNERKVDPTGVDPKTMIDHVEKMKITKEQKSALIKKITNSPKKGDRPTMQVFNTTRIYINSDDFAILKIDIETIRKIYENTVLKDSSLRFRATTQYKKDKDYNRYFLNSIQVSTVDLQKGRDNMGVPQLKEYELLRSPNKNNNSTNTLSAVDPNVDIYSLNFSYNREFWNNYNIIKIKPLNFSINGTFFETDNLEEIFIKN